MSNGNVAGWQTSDSGFFWHESCRNKVWAGVGVGQKVSPYVCGVCDFHVNWLHVSWKWPTHCRLNDDFNQRRRWLTRNVLMCVFICGLLTVISWPFRDIVSALTVVGHSPSLVRWRLTLCQIICETPLLAQQLSDNCWKHTFSLPISTFSALGVSHVMCYINLRYLLTYLLTYFITGACRRIFRWIRRHCHWASCTENSTCQRMSGMTECCRVLWDRPVQVRRCRSFYCETIISLISDIHIHSYLYL